MSKEREIGSCQFTIFEENGTATRRFARASTSGDQREVARWMIELGVQALARLGEDEVELDFLFKQAKQNLM